MKFAKRLILVTLLAIYSVTLCANTLLFVEPFKHNGIYYDIVTDSTAVVINANGYDLEDNWYEFYNGTVNIPSTVEYEGKSYTVTEIDKGAFSGQYGLTMVVIPKTITKICYRAFRGCTNLKAIAFASNGNLTTIEYEAFYGSAITSITFPNSLKTVGHDAFSGCVSLKSIKGGDSIEVFDDNIFQGCISLTDVSFSKSLKKIGDYAFWNCSALRNVTMNEGLKEIGNDAFLQCSSLENVSIPNTVKKIGWEAFRWCLNLKNIVIPNSVEEMDYGTFRYCSGLESVTLSNSLKEIPRYAFESTALTSIEFPDCVTKIHSFAFRGCANLENIKWGNSLEYIGVETFSATNISTLELPEPLKEIDQLAFSSCSNLTTVSIPQSTTIISNKVFESCSNLKTVYNYAIIPQNIPYDGSPFAFCNNPVEIHIFESLKETYQTTIGWAVNIENGLVTLIDDIPALKIEAITIDNSPLYCVVGETGTATATIYPTNAFSRELSWSCSDPSILYIDEFSGMYIGLEKGTASITASATDGSGVCGSTTVYVTDEAGVDEISIEIKPIVVYDIYGRKLLSPQKGLNIINGKKIFVR